MIFFVGFLVCRTGCLRILRTGKLDCVLEATQIVPSGDHVHRMAHRLFNPGSHLAGRPLALIPGWGLEPEVQRLTLDLTEQEWGMGTALATVPWSVGSANVVPGDGRADPVGGALHDLCDLATWSGVCGVAEQQQGLPTGAFIVRGRHLEPLTQFVQRQIGDDLYRFDSFSLTQNRMALPGFRGAM